MNRRALLSDFDAQIRRGSTPDPPNCRIERDDHVVRRWEHGWAGVTWSGLNDADADLVIAAQIARFAETGTRWEWKHYSHDDPPDLPDRLVAAGFTREPPEALLVAEIADLTLDTVPPAAVEVRAVRDRSEVEALVSVHDQVFGVEHSELREALLADLGWETGRVAAVVAWSGRTPIAAGRVEFNRGTDFAGLWGGGTLPRWRGRGVFRSLVAQRATLAAGQGYRYLQVDATPSSQPILERLGFVALAITTPFIHSGTAR